MHDLTRDGVPVASHWPTTCTWELQSYPAEALAPRKHFERKLAAN